MILRFLLKYAVNLGMVFTRWIGRKLDSLEVSKVDLDRALVEMEWVKENIKQPIELEEYFRDNNWKWESDPLSGFLDYVSDVEITFAKKAGDCDDLAEVWKWKFPFLKKYAVVPLNPFKEAGHVIAVGKVSPTRILVCSNLKILAWVEKDNEIEAIREVYKDSKREIKWIFEFNDKNFVRRVYAF